MAAWVTPAGLVFWQNFKMRLFKNLLFWLFFSGALLNVLASAPHTITLDGNMNEWGDDEIVWLDSQNDSPWGSFNELYKLGVTWDSDNFYFGLGAVLSSGNHLIVYIDTGTCGVSSVADLRSPEDINKRWYWAKNNYFDEGFRPSFQWHSYQTEFKGSAGGQGLYHYVYQAAQNVWQAQPATFLQSPRNPDSDGGVYREVEVAIPWTVLFGGVPAEGRVIKIIVSLNGGTDEGNGYYGSAHEAMPDQANTFPSVWYGSYTLTNYLTFVYDNGNNRSTIARNLTIETENNRAKIIWDKRGTRESTTYQVYHSTDLTRIKNLQGDYTETAENEIYLENLNRNVTYYVTIARKGENSRSELTHFILSGPVLSHKAVTNFSYPGKKCRLQFSSDRTLSTAKLYWRSGERMEFQEINLLSSGNTYYYDLTMPDASGNLDYYFVATDSEGATTLPRLSGNYYSITISSEIILNRAEQMIIPDEYNETNFSSYLDGENFLPGDRVRIRTFGYNDLDTVARSALPENLSLVCGYEISLQRGEKIYSPYFLGAETTLVLRHLSDYNISQLSLWYFDGRFWEKLDADSDNGRLRARIKALGRLAILAGSLPATAEAQKIARIAHSVFAPARGEFLEFIFAYRPTEIKFNVYNINGQRIYSGDSAIWNGRDSSGQIVEPGVYLYQLRYDGKKLTGSCVVLR